MTRLLRSCLAGLLLATAALPASAFPGRAFDPARPQLEGARTSVDPQRVILSPGPAGTIPGAGFSPQGLGFPVPPVALAVAGDVDANGASDWLLANPYFAATEGAISVGRVSVSMRDANGVFDVRDIDGPTNDANFGASVAPAGDVNGDGYDDVVVGAPGVGGLAGRVYVYRGGPTGLITQGPWIIEGSPLASFGFCVAYGGDVNGDGYDDILVGAPGFTAGLAGQGAAYCFLGGPGGPSPMPARTWLGDAASEYLGWAVAGGGDVNADGYADVLVGSPYHGNGQVEEGRVRLFLGGPSGPSSTASWTYESDVAFDHAGQVLAFPGDMNGDGYGEIALGIPAADANAIDDGRLLVFGGSPFVFFAPLLYEETGGVSGGAFGYDVEPAGDLNGDGMADLVAGMPFAGGSNDGIWYMLYGSPDMALAGLFLYNYGPPSWYAGVAVSGGGDDGDGATDLLVGVLVPAIKVSRGEGPAELLGLPPGPGMIPTSGVTLDAIGYFPISPFAQGNFDEFAFGSSAVVMDVNGDGYDDAIVGGSNLDAKLGGEGVVRAYYSGPAALAGDPLILSRTGEPTAPNGGPPSFKSPDWTFIGPHANGAFGFSLANAGDVNGDGYEDLLVGAPGTSVQFNAEGAAYLFYGGPEGLGTQPDWHSEGLAEFMWHGFNVAGAGDVNQDGYADFLIGAPLASPGGVAQAGQVALHYGSAIGPVHVPVRVWTGTHTNATMGSGSCGAGDVDDDGFPDVLINEPGFAGAETNEGRFRIFRGGAAGPETDAFFTYESNAADQYFALYCAPAGDVNGDGFADVLIGSPDYTETQPGEGAVHVFTGRPGGMSLFATLAPGVAGSSFGRSISTAGDVNKDGYSEILIGAPEQSGPISAPGTVAEGTEGGGTRAADTRPLRDRLLSPDPAAPAGLAQNGVAYLFYGDPTSINPAGARTFQGINSNLGYAVAGGGDINADGWPDFLYSEPNGDGIKVLDNGLVSVAYSNIVSTGVPRPERLLLTDATAPLPHGGRSNSATAFRVSGLGRHPMGRGRARMQWQAKAPGAPFDGTGIQSSTVLRTGVPTDELGSTATYGGLASGLSQGQRYRVRVRYTTRNPYFPRTRWITSERDGILQSDLRTFGPTGAVDVDDPVAVASGLSFAGPWPNPLAGAGTLSFSLPAAGRVTIDAYDANGRRVARLHDGEAAAGPSTITWNGRDDVGHALPGGLYFLRLKSEAGEKTVKAVLAR